MVTLCVWALIIVFFMAWLFMSGQNELKEYDNEPFFDDLPEPYKIHEPRSHVRRIEPIEPRDYWEKGNH
jgi:hypothetical protein